MRVSVSKRVSVTGFIKGSKNRSISVSVRESISSIDHESVTVSAIVSVIVS